MAKIKREEILLIVFRTLPELLLDGQKEVPTDETNPIDDWGLESMHGVEYACTLSDELGIEIPLGDNPLVDVNNGKKRARTVAEIVDYLLELQEGQNG